MLHIEPRQKIILILNGLSLAVFTCIYIAMQKREFIIYVGVILAAIFFLMLSNKSMKYSNGLLWLLTLWAFLHMAGGCIPVGEGRLYDTLLLNLVSKDEYQIFRYDQFVHIIGFGAATWLVYDLAVPFVRPPDRRKKAFAFIIIMAGLGVGAMNEIVEFGVQLVDPASGVGGYENTSLDLVSDLIGAVLAFIFIRWTEGKEEEEEEKVES